MPTLLTQISPLVGGIDTNTIIENCCAPVFVTWRNDHGTSLTITDLTFNELVSPSIFTFTLLDIDGNAAPGCFPFIIAAGDTFITKVEICCGNINIGKFVEFIFDIAGHPNDTHTFGFGQALPNGNDTALCCADSFPNGMNFGSVEIGNSASLPFEMCNQTVQTFTIDINWSGTGSSDVTFDLPLQQIMNPGDTFSGNFIWTPTSIYSLNSKADGTILDCGSEGCNGTLIGQSIVGCECLCCDQITIGDYKNAPVIAQTGFCESSDVYNVATICEEKLIQYQLRYDPGITAGAFQVFFNPWMFANFCDIASKYPGGNINSQPPVSFFFDYLASMSVGTTYPMTLIGAASNFFNQLNYSCDITIQGANLFVIEFKFYMIEDIDDWLTNVMINNQPKWRRNNINAVNPNEGDPILDNSMPSVYNMPKKLCSLFYTIDNFNLINDNPRECYYINSISWTARYYNKGLYNGASEFTNHNFTFIRNSQNVTSLSTVDETTVEFEINIPAGYGTLAAIWFQLFQETDTNNNVDFLANYDSSRGEILTNPVAGVIDNHLRTPSLITNVGTVYTITAQIGTTVDLSKTYRLAAIVYASDGVTVNTFVSDALQVSNVPTWDCENCQIQPIESTFANYYHSIETECFRPVAKERIKHSFTIDQNDFVDCLSEYGTVNEWRIFLKSIQLNVYRREINFPSSGQSTLFVWQTHQSNRIVGFPNNWQNLGSMVVADSGSTVDIEFTTNILWQTTPFSGTSVLTCNNSTYMNRTNVGALGSVYATTLGILNDWRGETIYLEYVFNFDLALIMSVPSFNLSQVMAFRLRPIENESNNSGFDPIIESMLIECETSPGNYVAVTNGQICPDTCSNVRVTYCANQPGKFILFANPINGGVAQLIEFDPVVSPQNLPAFIASNMDEDFDNCASIVFSMDQWPSGQYELCGYISVEPNPNFFKVDFNDCGVGIDCGNNRILISATSPILTVPYSILVSQGGTMTFYDNGDNVIGTLTAASFDGVYIYFNSDILCSTFAGNSCYFTFDITP